MAANKELIDLENEFKKALPRELVSLYEKFSDALDTRNFLSVVFYFKEGLKTGVLIGIEVMEP